MADFAMLDVTALDVVLRRMEEEPPYGEVEAAYGREGCDLVMHTRKLWAARIREAVHLATRKATP